MIITYPARGYAWSGNHHWRYGLYPIPPSQKTFHLINLPGRKHPDMKKTIGLALSGGGARGFAHIGVLKILDKYDIHPQIVTGTSMGGLIAAAYASGCSLDELEQRAIKLSSMRELVKLLDLHPSRRGFLDWAEVFSYIREIIPESKVFDELNLNLGLCAVDINTAQEVQIRSGSVLDAVSATIAFPGLFSPVKFKDHLLVDGGILNNLPSNLAREMGADIVIAVDAQTNPSSDPPWQTLPYKPRWPIPLPGFIQDIYRAGLIMVERIAEMNLEKSQPDLLLRPSMAADITMFFGFIRSKEIILAGEQTAQSNIETILSLVNG